MTVLRNKFECHSSDQKHSTMMLCFLSKSKHLNIALNHLYDLTQYTSLTSSSLTAIMHCLDIFLYDCTEDFALSLSWVTHPDSWLTIFYWSFLRKLKYPSSLKGTPSNAGRIRYRNTIVIYHNILQVFFRGSFLPMSYQIDLVFITCLLFANYCLGSGEVETNETQPCPEKFLVQSMQEENCN